MATIARPELLCDTFLDLAYGEGDRNVLDLYLPAQQGAPLLLFVHAGAWIKGDKAEYAELGRFYASQGIATAVINYRRSLNGANRHPGHVEDLVTALAWLQQQRSRFGFGAEVYVSGHSAGAHMAGVLTTSSDFGKVVLAGCIGLEGIYDIPRLHQVFPTYKDWFLTHAFGDEALWPAASPQFQAVINPMRWLVIHSLQEELVDLQQSTDWVRKLTQEQVPAELVASDFGSHYDVVRAAAKPSAVSEAIITFIIGS